MSIFSTWIFFLFEGGWIPSGKQLEPIEVSNMKSFTMSLRKVLSQAKNVLSCRCLSFQKLLEPFEVSKLRAPSNLLVKGPCK